MATKYGIASTAASASQQVHLGQALLPEFMALSKNGPLFTLLFGAAFLVQIGPFCGVFIDVIAHTATNEKPRKWRRICLICVLLAVELFALAVIIFFPETTYALNIISTMGFACLIIFVMECTLFIYGFNEHQVDLGALYPLKRSWRDSFGPMSSFYLYGPRITQFLLIFFMLICSAILSKIEFDSTTTFMTYGTGALLAATFLGGLIVDLAWINRKQLPLSRAFYPQKGHKAYYRFFKGHDDILEEKKRAAASYAESQNELNQEAATAKNPDVSSDPSSCTVAETEMFLTVEQT